MASPFFLDSRFFLGFLNVAYTGKQSSFFFTPFHIIVYGFLFFLFLVSFLSSFFFPFFFLFFPFFFLFSFHFLLSRLVFTSRDFWRTLGGRCNGPWHHIWLAFRRGLRFSMKPLSGSSVRGTSSPHVVFLASSSSHSIFSSSIFSLFFFS